MNRVGCATLVTGLVAVLSSCYPGEVTNITETDLVVSGARPDYTFTKKTYFMPDTVFYIQADTLAPDTFDHAFDADIDRAVARNLGAAGYTRIDDFESADIVLLNGISVNINVSVYTWWPGYWGPYWPCCFGPVYPWWPVTGATTWKSGTVLTIMLDKSLESGDDNGEVWAGAMNGLAEGSEDLVRTRLVGGIDQAFTQSPYLSGGGS